MDDAYYIINEIKKYIDNEMYNLERKIMDKLDEIKNDGRDLTLAVGDLEREIRRMKEEISNRLDNLEPEY
ncbi:hypothetical protein GIJ05_06195 [Laceyella tengchongensis]|nr:hypothetical protein [Laceyella tengchongensis]